MRRSASRYADRFVGAVQISGSETHSISGTPARLKSTSEYELPAMRPSPEPACVDLPGILFQVDAREAALLHRAVLEPVAHHAALRERHVVLRDLIILGHVRIEIVLAVELRKRRDLGAEREPGANHVLDRACVRHRQRAGQRQGTPDRPSCSVRRRTRWGSRRTSCCRSCSSTWHSMPMTASYLGAPAQPRRMRGPVTALPILHAHSRARRSAGCLRSSACSVARS